MTEQAILDLPLIEFEQFGGSIEALRRHCAQVYGLVGLPPHPDTVFHFAASLWRCHTHETQFQIAAIAAFSLRAISHLAAAERHLAAEKETARELEGADARETIGNAVENARYAREDADALGRLTLDIAAGLASDGRRADQSLRSLADTRWQQDLAQMVTPLLSAKPDLIDWSLELPEVLDELSRHQSTLARAAAASARSGRLGALMSASSPALAPVPQTAALEPLQRELTQAQRQVETLAAQLQHSLQERRDLEEVLHATERNFTEQSLALEEAKNALQLTLGEVRDRLNRLETDQAAARSGAEADDLRRERDALAEELTRALERVADGDARREEMLAAQESGAAQAAAAIGDLKRKVENQRAQIQQGEAKLAGLNQTLDDLRRELVESEQRFTGAQATLSALEAESVALRAEADRFAQAEKLLTEAESRLAEAEQRAVEADLRVQQIETVVAEKDVKLANGDHRLREQKAAYDKLAAQLAQTDKAASDRLQQVRTQESDLARARQHAADAQRAGAELQKQLGDAQRQLADSQRQLADAQRQLAESRKQLSDESAKLKQLSEREKRFIEDSGKLKSSLDEHRETSARLKASLDQRERELGDLRTEVREKSSLRDRTESEAKNLRYDLDKMALETAELRKAGEDYRRRVTETELRLMDAEQKLLAAGEDAAAAQARAKDAEEKLNGDLALLRDRLKNADSEKQILLDALSRSEENRRIEKAELEKQMEALRAESAQRHQTMLKIQAEGEKTRKRLDESDAFLIARQREMDRVNNKLRYVLGEISSLADLRARIENSRDDAEIQKLAHDVAQRLDNLFSEAGSPVHADRRTEKIVVLHLKKTDDEQAKDAPKPVLAIGKNSNGDDEDPSAKTSLGLETPEKKPRKGK